MRDRAESGEFDELIRPSQAAEFHGKQSSEQCMRRVLVTDEDRSAIVHGHPARPLKGRDCLPHPGATADEDEVLRANPAIEHIVERLEPGGELHRPSLGRRGSDTGEEVRRRGHGDQVVRGVQNVGHVNLRS